MSDELDAFFEATNVENEGQPETERLRRQLFLHHTALRRVFAALEAVDPEDVECPECGAKPKSSCFVNAPERISIRPHDARWKAAMLQAAKNALEVKS